MADLTGRKKFYAAFLSLFIIVGLGMAIFGFVRLGRYNAAEKVQATVISAVYNAERREMDVVFSFERNGEEITVKKRFLNVTVNKKGKLPYYEGLITTIRINRKNAVEDYGAAEIAVTAGGGVFFTVGCAFMYVFVLKKENWLKKACDYENAMVDPESLSDETQRIEAEADALSMLPERSVERTEGEIKLIKPRFRNRLASFSRAENIFCTIFLAGTVVAMCFVLKSVLFGIIAGLFAFCFMLLLLKLVYGLYLKIVQKRGGFSVKKLAVVEVCAFESEAGYQQGRRSRKNIIFKKFRVVARIDGKRSVGYVTGNIPPPRGAVLKVLVRPKKFNRWVIDNNP